MRMTFSRLVVPAVAAAVVTFLLFLLMQYLIIDRSEPPAPVAQIKIFDITIPDPELDVQRTEPRPEPPDEVPELPDLPRLSDEINAPDGPTLSFNQLELGPGVFQETTLKSTDMEFLPIVTVPPQYPSRAVNRRIEGWCHVSFTVNENGGVEDPRVVDAEPPEIFNQASLRAVQRFRFNPRMVDGNPVRTEDVEYIFTYRLNN